MSEWQQVLSHLVGSGPCSLLRWPKSVPQCSCLLHKFHILGGLHMLQPPVSCVSCARNSSSPASCTQWHVPMCCIRSVSNSGPRPTQMTLVPFVQLLNDGPDWGIRRRETDVNRKSGFKISKTLYLYSDVYSCHVHFYYIGNVCIESLYSNVRK